MSWFVFGHVFFVGRVDVGKGGIKYHNFQCFLIVVRVDPLESVIGILSYLRDERNGSESAWKKFTLDLLKNQSLIILKRDNGD